VRIGIGLGVGGMGVEGVGKERGELLFFFRQEKLTKEDGIFLSRQEK